ncbi:MAG: helix-turn-helix transcriptional regulator, partial [Candidatus Izemoplasmatales bacterium]|nr:helix-turn-helix transcriptional regulator [Candidatus Izemoplasmatales bacterium]
MDTRLLNELKRRRQEIYKFYYLEIGSAIRKKRLEHKLTQEDLAKGICSNTYLSKIEHNAIAVNKDSLFMIMERINMSTEEYGFPEEMVNYMEKSIDFFFKGDKSGFRTLYEDSLQYQFGILVEVSRLGYFVMIGDKINAKVLYDELHRYLCSVENYGITIFTLFSCFYHILMD